MSNIIQLRLYRIANEGALRDAEISVHIPDDDVTGSHRPCDYNNNHAQFVDIGTSDSAADLGPPIQFAVDPVEVPDEVITSM